MGHDDGGGDMMLLNKFASPLGEGTYRAALNALATLVVVTLTTFQGLVAVDPTGMAIPETERWKSALIAGVIAALSPFVTGAMIAASDQRRAERSDFVPADVPIAAGRRG